MKTGSTNRVFSLSILGLTIDQADQLVAALRMAAAVGDVIVGKRDRYGQRYVIDFGFAGSGGTATIRSAWIIKETETEPRLVTCYIL